jgi:hypothetical protein
VDFLEESVYPFFRLEIFRNKRSAVYESILGHGKTWICASSSPLTSAAKYRGCKLLDVMDMVVETSVNLYQTTWHNIPEDSHPHKKVWFPWTLTFHTLRCSRHEHGHSERRVTSSVYSKLNVLVTAGWDRINDADFVCVRGAEKRSATVLTHFFCSYWVISTRSDDFSLSLCALLESVECVLFLVHILSTPLLRTVNCCCTK